MTTLHPTDNEIQEYSLHNISDTITINHIQQCAECSLKATQYKMMFESIKQQSTPAFDFNLTQLVMERLPVTKKKFSTEKYFIYFIIVVVLLAFTLMVYPVRNYLANTIMGLTLLSIFLITTAALVLSGFLIADMYKKFKAQMDILNYC